LRGRIAAGQPIEAVEDVEATLDLGAALARRGDELYALRVVGTSMIEDLIMDGDVVVVRRQETAADGETVVALLMSGTAPAGAVTLKRFYREPDGRVRLQPANSALTPLIVAAGDVRIQGTVVAVLRDV
jgi:repressor LexA